MSRAILSACGLYRFRLERWWGDGAPMVFVMLNPSTADADNDDPTIRRCVKFAKRENCGGLVVVNLYAWCATDPKELKNARDPIGFPNLAHLFRVVREQRAHGGPIVCAWGAGAKGVRIPLVLWSAKLYALGVTKDGHPRHPLYVKGDAPLVRYYGGK